MQQTTLLRCLRLISANKKELIQLSNNSDMQLPGFCNRWFCHDLASGSSHDKPLMYSSQSFPSKRFNFKLFRVATAFWLLCIGNTCTAPTAVGSCLQAGEFPVVGRSRQEIPELLVPAQRCLIRTLPEAGAVRALLWGSFWHTALLPSRLTREGAASRAQLGGWAGSSKDKTGRVLLCSPRQVPGAKLRVC